LPICRYAAGLALLRCGFVEEAAAVVEDGLKILPEDVFLRRVLAMVRARQDRAAEAHQIRAALAAEACGDMESVGTLFTQAVEEREPLAVINFADRRIDPDFQARDQAVLARMNLA
jgi:hypothetical protein